MVEGGDRGTCEEAARWLTGFQVSREYSMRAPIVISLVVLVMVAMAGGYFLLTSEAARLSDPVTIGASPQLPEPIRSLIPTVNIAHAKGWSNGERPTPAAGLSVAALATGLDHPRWLYVLPNGDVLVAETNAPDRPDDGKGIKGFAYRTAQKWAGAGVPTANRITLLRPSESGEVTTKTTFLKDLNSPYGMALVGEDLYVANTDAVVKFHYKDGATEITEPGTKLVDLPAGPIDHHWTKNLLASHDGSLLYATVGSNSNAGENGLDNEENRAAILEIERATGKWRIFASGLRNPNGLGWEPETGALWTVVNERDELGSDLVPDYLTSIRGGGFYGWPFSYWGDHVDSRVPENPAMVAKAIVPDYALGNHVAPLGLTFYDAGLLPAQFRGGAFIGEHGSWNRRPASGYKVVFVPFQNGRPSGEPVDVLTGFLGPSGEARGRPVGVAVDKVGALLVADDVGNTVWRVTPGGANTGASGVSSQGIAQATE
jgi:glucose/arabinose dehydrogenase